MDTAHKVLIRDVLIADFVKKEGWEPSYLLINGMNVSKLNVIGIVTLIEGSALFVDDGSGTVSVRNFESIKGISVGDTALCIARPREYDGEKYLFAEIVKKIEPGWLIHRKKELKQTIPKNIEIPKPKKKQKKIVQKVEGLSKTDSIMKIIGDLDEGAGADIDSVIKNSGSEQAESTINKLIELGEIFQCRPGKVKVL